MRRFNARRLAFAAVVGAAYASLTLLTAPISFGPVQVRLAEALCVLPYLFPDAAWGLFLGCAIANLFSTAGPLDVVFGSLATLAAGLLTARLGARGRLRALACLMPVLVNGVVVGAVLAVTGAERALFLSAWAIYGGLVAAGEAAAMFALGYPMLLWLPGSRVYARLRAMIFRER